MPAALLAALALAAAPGRGPCAPEGTLRFVCGIKAPEDLVAIPGGRWIVTGGNVADGSGGLYLIEIHTRRVRRLPIGGAGPDRTAYPDCAAPPNPRRFAAHGLSLRGSTLYVVGHGGREAVEVFALSGGSAPSATWVGCVMAPAGASLNSVAGARGGEILATSLFTAPANFQDVFAGRVTGAVYGRMPGQPFREVPGTKLSGDNGLEVSPDGKWLFVAATGSRQVLRYDRADMTRPPLVATLNFLPDNLRWAPDGRLLVAGEAGSVFTVASADPATLALKVVASGPTTKAFAGVSGGLLAGGLVWLASHDGERVAYTRPPR